MIESPNLNLALGENEDIADFMDNIVKGNFNKLDEIIGNNQNLNTSSKEISGAINELYGLMNLVTPKPDNYKLPTDSPETYEEGMIIFNVTSEDWVIQNAPSSQGATVITYITGKGAINGYQDVIVPYQDEITSVTLSYKIYRRYIIFNGINSYTWSVISETNPYGKIEYGTVPPSELIPDGMLYAVIEE